MTVEDLKKKLKDFNDNDEVLFEEKISGDEFPFETMAGMYERKGYLVIYIL